MSKTPERVAGPRHHTSLILCTWLLCPVGGHIDGFPCISQQFLPSSIIYEPYHSKKRHWMYAKGRADIPAWYRVLMHCSYLCIEFVSNEWRNIYINHLLRIDKYRKLLTFSISLRNVKMHHYNYNFMKVPAKLCTVDLHYIKALFYTSLMVINDDNEKNTVTVRIHE